MPSWRHIRTEIEEISDRYLVAVSGGIDSVFLLDFMSRTNTQIEVVHFNHGIRDDSDNDEILVKQLSDKYSISCWTEKSNTLSATSNEVEARQERWNFIETVAKDRNINHVVTAHHADDQIENVLIRLMRGDPHDSLCMPKLVEKNGLVRYKPLLSVYKQDIIYQSEQKQLTWNEDSTNTSEQYDRNFVRNTVLPLLATRTNIYQSILTGVNKTANKETGHG